MTDCCSTTCDIESRPRKYKCPVNGKEYKAVSSTTMMHHINGPWKWLKKDQGYYFCEDPACNVVYFGEDATVIEKTALRTVVGIKEKSKNRLVCYCFGITMEEAMKHPEVKEFVIQETKGHACACETRNPSGRCCLKDFPKL